MRFLNRKDWSKLNNRRDCKETRVKSQRQRLMRKIGLFNNYKKKYKKYRLRFKLKIRESDFYRNR